MEHKIIKHYTHERILMEDGHYFNNWDKKVIDYYEYRGCHIRKILDQHGKFMHFQITKYPDKIRKEIQSYLVATQLRTLKGYIDIVYKDLPNSKAFILE